MATLLSSQTLIEKNRLSTTGVWLVFVDIRLPEELLYTRPKDFKTEDDLHIRVVSDTQSHTWRGQEWEAFAFELGHIGDAKKGEVPKTTLKISNHGKQAQYYVELGDGGVGSLVTIYVANSKHLDNPDPAQTFSFEATKCTCSTEWITFTISAENPYSLKFPRNSVHKNDCRFKFKGPRCQYDGPDLSCSHDLDDCRSKNNSHNFGGFTGVGNGGLFF